MAATAVDVAQALDAQGIGSLVVDPRWVLPVSPELVRLAGEFELVAHLEDGLVTGGVGSALRDALADAGSRVPVQVHGIPQAFHHHARRDELIEEFHLRPTDVAMRIAGALLQGDAVDEDAARLLGG